MKGPLPKLFPSKRKQFSKGCRLETVISQVLYNNAFELYVYDSRKNMQFGIRKWLISNKYTNVIDYDISGVVLTNDKLTIIKDEDGMEKRIFAAMFLCEEDFDMNLLTHESIHAAMILEREVLRFCGLYDGNDESGYAPEERLAYTVGEFVDVILEKCIEANIKVRFITKKCK